MDRSGYADVAATLCPPQENESSNPVLRTRCRLYDISILQCDVPPLTDPLNLIISSFNLKMYQINNLDLKEARSLVRRLTRQI